MLARAGRWLLVLVLTLGVQAAAVPVRADDLPRVTALRFGQQEGRTRVVLDVDRRLDYRLDIATDPIRLVIDLPAVVWDPQPGPLSKPRGIAIDQRFGPSATGGDELEVLTRSMFRIASAKWFPPVAGSAARRLVVDLDPADQPSAEPPAAVTVPIARPRTRRSSRPRIRRSMP